MINEEMDLLDYYNAMTDHRSYNPHYNEKDAALKLMREFIAYLAGARPVDGYGLEVALDTFDTFIEIIT